MFWNANASSRDCGFMCFAADWGFWRCAISSGFAGNGDLWSLEF